MFRTILAALWALTALAATPAQACSTPHYQDDGRYVGGDLATQIADRADTIQIVEITQRRIVRRTFTEGDWYRQHGDTDVPAHMPEYIDEFVFELTIVETLKNDTPPRDTIYENNLRISGYSLSELTSSMRQATPARHPNSLPDWVLDRPGDQGMAFGGAMEGAGLGFGSCNAPYLLDVGQRFVALRDSMGRLYRMFGGYPLQIDAEFDAHPGERVSFNMQSLIPIESADDAFLVRLRRALSAR